MAQLRANLIPPEITNNSDIVRSLLVHLILHPDLCEEWTYFDVRVSILFPSLNANLHTFPSEPKNSGTL